MAQRKTISQKALNNRVLLEEVKSKNIEEYWNILTHIAGAAMAVAGLFFLLSLTSISESDFKFVSVMIFGLSSIFVYTASSLYHYNWDKPFKKIYRTLDHIFIFYLIAGSYTPFMLITFDLEKGWNLFLAVWVVAFIGTLFKFFFTGKYEKFSVFFYVGMGWMIILEFKEFLASTPPTTFYLLLGGGILYCAGVIFYLRDSMKFNHAIWHVFVIAGNFLHFCAVYTIL